MAGGDDLFDDELDLDELFQPDVDEALGVATRKKVCKLARVGQESPSEALELLANEATVTLAEGEDGGQLVLEASLANHLGKPLELDELVLVLRDEAGELLDVVDRWVSTKFSRAQEVVCELDLGPGVAAEVASVEVVAEYDVEFQALMALGLVGDVPFLGDVPHRRRFEVDTRPSPAQPGMPSWDVKLSGFVVYGWESEIEVIVEAREHSEAADASREVVVALRDKSGALLIKDSVSLDKLTSPTRARAKVTMPLPAHELHGLARIDVAVSGTLSRRESLGSFEIVRMH